MVVGATPYGKSRTIYWARTGTTGREGILSMYAKTHMFSAVIGWCFLCGVVCCPTAQAARKTQAPPERPAVPGEEALKAARASVREMLGLGPKLTVKDPQNTVDKLLRTGKGTKKDPAGRYACFELALKIATDAKSPTMVLDAAGEIAENFKVSPIKCKGDALTALARKIRSKSAAPEMAGAYEGLLIEAIAADDFDQADKAVAGAKRFAALSKDSVMLRRLRDEQRRMLPMKRALVGVTKANETLKTSPDDPEANETVGGYHCFLKGDWLRGLSMLAKCSDEAIMRAAKNELANPEPVEDKLAIGDAWWDLASKHRDKTAATSIKMHAGACYEEVIDDLTGLQKAKYEKRIQDSGIRGAAAGRYSASAAKAAIAKLLKLKTLMIYMSFDRKTLGKKEDKPIILNLAKIDKPGTLKGKPKLVKGKVGDALEFEGKVSYISIPFRVVSEVQITSMVWVKWAGGKTGRLSVYSGGGGFGIDPEGSGWTCKSGGGIMSWKKRGEKASVRRPKPDQWYHLAATYDGKMARFYVNGIEVASRAIASSKWSSWGASVAGSSMTKTLFDGVVDEVYVFSHAMTAADIAAYHKATAGK
jgi:hypothetical protein